MWEREEREGGRRGEGGGRGRGGGTERGVEGMGRRGEGEVEGGRGGVIGKGGGGEAKGVEREEWGGKKRGGRGRPVVSFHGANPATEAVSRLAGFLHNIRLKVRLVHVRPDLLHHFPRYVVLVVGLQLVQKACRLHANPIVRANTNNVPSFGSFTFLHMSNN